MAIGFDSSGSGFNDTAVSSDNYSMTNTAGTGLFVGLYRQTSAATSTCTAGGVSMTKVEDGSLFSNGMDIFFLANPPTGSISIAFTFSVTTTAWSSVAASYTGVGTPQTDGQDTEGSGATSSIGAFPTTTAAEWIISCTKATNTDRNISGYTKRGSVTSGNNKWLDIWDSNADVASGGQTITLTQSFGAATIFAGGMKKQAVNTSRSPAFLLNFV